MIGRVLDWFWPRNCEVCGRPVDRAGRHLCSDCLNQIPFVPTAGCCSVCGRAVEGLDVDYVCEDCERANTRPLFDAAASAVSFEGQARQMILDFKFNRHLWLRDDFVDWLEATARTRFDLAAVDVVLPMPITLVHRIDRGYNQSSYLARPFARRIDRRFDAALLTRIGNPKRQAGLSEAERRENAKGTVAVRNAALLRGRTVLVIDDVMTTGSTLSECAKAIKGAGAWRVWCLALARSLRD